MSQYQPKLSRMKSTSVLFSLAMSAFGASGSSESNVLLFTVAYAPIYSPLQIAEEVYFEVLEEN